MTTPVLNAKNLTIEFGGLEAVCDFELAIPKGKIYGLIGPNGAGKTTVFNLLTGVYQPTRGEIDAFGKSIVGLKPNEITQRGFARTFQNIRLFKELTVLENLLISMDFDPDYGQKSWIACLLRSSGALEHEGKKRRHATELLDIFKLSDRLDELAKNLPYGDQRKLEIARAIATGAQLLLFR